MIGAELEAQRSSPAEFARGMMAAIHDPYDAKAIAAMRNVADVLIMHANSLRDKPWR
jgi:hypothetical protein